MNTTVKKKKKLALRNCGRPYFATEPGHSVKGNDITIYIINNLMLLFIELPSVRGLLNDSITAKIARIANSSISNRIEPSTGIRPGNCKYQLATNIIYNLKLMSFM